MALTQVQTAMLGTGAILQVVQATSTASALTTSGTFISTGFSASITPKFATSKILAIHNASCNNQSAGGQVALTLARNSTVLGSAGGLAGTYGNQANVAGSIGFCYLDSPATTSSVTYTVYFAAATGGVNVTFNNPTAIGNSTTTLTLMEIAG
jgi:hypothetical protein